MMETLLKTETKYFKVLSVDEFENVVSAKVFDKTTLKSFRIERSNFEYLEEAVNDYIKFKSEDYDTIYRIVQINMGL